MNPWTYEWVRRSVAGGWLREPTGGAAPPRGASIDTRELEPGQVFFAMRGERTDGHDWLVEAGERGASVLVVDDEAKARDAGGEIGPATLLVADVPTALVKLASAWRNDHGSTQVVGVTGSNGKTTCVRLIDAVLAGGGMRGSRSVKSFNNAIGVPLTLLNAPHGAQYVVCEMGTSEPGEMETLARLARPHVAVITSIGRAHTGPLGGAEGIAREKSAILAGEDAGVGIVPAGCEPLEAVMRRTGSDARFVRVGTGEGADIRVGDVRVGARGVSFSVNRVERYRTRLIGAHNAHNAAIAVVVGKRFGLDAETIAKGLLAAEPAEMRLAVERVRLDPAQRPAVVLNDAYNANPDSMLAGLATLEAWKPATGGRRVAVLGDMHELGDAEGDAHAEVVGACARSRRIHAVVLVGPKMAAAGKSAGVEGVFVPGGDDAGIAKAAGQVRPGDAVLVKASRASRLERFVGALRARAVGGGGVG